MAKVTFKHTSHDTLSQVYVKKRTFRRLLVLQLITSIALGFSCYKLNSYGYFNRTIIRIKHVTIKNRF